MKNTKTNLLMVALVATMAFSGVSQTAQAQARMGVKGGLNVSNFTKGDNVSDSKARIGFNAGIYGQVISTDVAALQLELLYSTKGNEATYTSLGVDNKLRINLGYIDLPILAVFKLGDAAEIHAGGYASYLISSSFENDNQLFGSSSGSINKDDLNTFDYGLIGGIGFNFGALQIGARYNYGLGKVVKDDDASEFLDNPRNSVAQLYLAFNFAQN